MLEFDSEIVGKDAQFGFLRDNIKRYGFSIGGNWEFHKGSFDTPLWKDGGDTIYLRLPFVVMNGMLDSENAQIRFLKPFVIRHIANVGLDYDDASLLEPTGFSQFQTPTDKDATITNKSKWISAGEQAIDKVLPYLN
nr:YugN family protein [Lysinibacillus timonensis]